MVQLNTAFAAYIALSGLVILPVATGLLQQDSSRQRHEGSMLTHNLAHTLVRSLTLSEEELGHPACDIECNGDKMRVGSPGEERGRSCWGKFHLTGFGPETLASTNCHTLCGQHKVHLGQRVCEHSDMYQPVVPPMQKCSFTMEHITGSSLYKCDGSFTFVPVNESNGVGVHALFCEGAMFTMSEIVPIERQEATEDPLAAPSFLQSDPPIGCPGGKCVSALFCLANSQIISAETEGYRESYVHCEDVLGYGNVNNSTSEESPQRGRKEQLHNHKEPTIAELLEQSMTDSSWEGWLDTSTSTNGVASSLARVAESDMQAASSNSQLRVATKKEFTAHSDVDGHKKWTCNKKKINPWFSWWPCWGLTELEIKVDSGDDRAYYEAACHGFSVPSHFCCKGLSTAHFKGGNMKNGLIESMEVTKGKKHSRRFHKGGWEGYITFAKGFSTIHFRSVAPDFDRNLWPVFGHGMVPFMSSEPAEDVRMVMDAVTKAAIREQN